MVLGLALFSSLLLSQQGFAALPERRLLEIAPGERVWADEADRLILSEQGHQRGACPGFIDVTDYPNEPISALDARVNPLNFEADPAFPVETQQVLAQLSARRFEAAIDHLQSYWNRYYTTNNAIRSAAWIYSQFQAAGRSRGDVTVKYFEHQGWPQPSVIARIRGTDDSGEAIVLGAHEDSINRQVKKRKIPGARAPGADDNASGTSAVIEIFRAIVDSGVRPKRDIYFMTYAAEEVGLRGSMDIANTFSLRNLNVVAVLNLDMILYKGPKGMMGVTTSNTDPELTGFVKKLIDRYVGAPWKTRSCGYACSDHASWDRNGYRAAFLFETVDDISPWWHHPNDTLNASTNIEWGMNFVKTGAAFATELGLAPSRF